MQNKSSNATHLFAQQCDHVLAAAVPEQFPPTQGEGSLPEIALIGRSNVGKSSLLNALTGRKALARASNTPGRTQQIVFFNLGNRLMLVDLPGYGHAEAPGATKAQWMGLVRRYLQVRPNLKLVLLLIDSRHGAMARDHEMMDFLDKAACSYQVILTKTDQLRPSLNAPPPEAITALLKKHPAARPTPMLSSSEKKTGIAEIQELMASFALAKF